MGKGLGTSVKNTVSINQETIVIGTGQTQEIQSLPKLAHTAEFVATWLCNARCLHLLFSCGSYLFLRGNVHRYF